MRGWHRIRNDLTFSSVETLCGIKGYKVSFVQGGHIDPCQECQSYPSNG